MGQYEITAEDFVLKHIESGRLITRNNKEVDGMTIDVYGVEQRISRESLVLLMGFDFIHQCDKTVKHQLWEGE